MNLEANFLNYFLSYVETSENNVIKFSTGLKDKVFEIYKMEGESKLEGLIEHIIPLSSFEQNFKLI